MGGFLSTDSECDCTGTVINETANSITLAPTNVNPDIAGIGIQQRVQQNKTTLRHIAEAVLLTLSDQQLVIAPATLATAGLKGNWCSLSAYRMKIVSYRAVLVIVTHLGSLVTSTYYFQYKAVGSFRAIMILCTVVLTAVFANKRTSTYFPTNRRNLKAGLAACLVSNNSEKTVATASGIIECYFLCVSYLISLIIAFVHSRHIVQKGRHVTSQKISYALLYTLRNWMINESKLLNEGDPENEWEQELLKYPAQDTSYYGNQGTQGYQSPQGYHAPYGNRVGKDMFYND
ncbi:hypothetical protein QQZ08_011190 [Neonectria magnoliae]|uniref:Uncharacterized protein n=1 Tax=Neonectria magnoliae TaxID=2732573 RepID=A0ABR1HDH5_9HYPO